MNVRRSRPSSFLPEMGKGHTNAFQTVNESDGKFSKRTNVNANESKSSSSRLLGPLMDILTSNGSTIIGRTVTREEAEREMEEQRLLGIDPDDIEDILEMEGMSDLLMDTEYQPFEVSFKATSSQEVDPESFFVGLLDNKPQDLPESVHPNPDDYITPKRARFVMESVTNTISINSSVAIYDRQHKTEKSALAKDFQMPGPSQRPNSDSLFKVPYGAPSTMSTTSKNQNLSLDQFRIDNRPYSSPPVLTTPLFNPNVSGKTPGIPTSTTSSISGTGNCRASSKAGISSHSLSTASYPTCVIMAVTSGWGGALGEIGIAAIDLKRPSFILTQYSDSQTFMKTLAKINIYHPTEILLPDTLETGHNKLFKTIIYSFQRTRITTVKRQYFNSEYGLQQLKNLCHPDYSNVDLILVNKYYCLCAASAVIMYVEKGRKKTFVNNSLKITYETAEGTAMIDLETARRLELVANECNQDVKNKYTLYNLLNQTVTLGGCRKLRAEILQPPATLNKIEERLKIVKYLVENENVLLAIQNALSKFYNVERLLWMCSKNTILSEVNSGTISARRIDKWKNDNQICATLTNYILLLKQLLEEVPELKEVLSNTELQYFQDKRDMLEDQRYDAIKEKLYTKLHEDAKPTRGFEASELNRCFCIKRDINSLLDVAREAYSTLLTKMQRLVSRYTEQTGIQMGLCLTADLGFHVKFSLGIHESNNFKMPAFFTDVKRKGKIYHATSLDMFTYNIRAEKVVQEIHLITNAILIELLEEIRHLIGCVYNLSEVISELDVMCSLAVASNQKDYVIPTFTSEITIIDGRHPVLDKHNKKNPIPNSTFASKNKNFNIITGPNMGGKTIYVFQIAVLQIMAQVGCYVPARSAEFRITDHVFVREGLVDSINYRASSFYVEMKELMYTMDNMTKSSLIILDEICSGVDAQEGTAIAWAICEQFLKSSAFTFLTTHYLFLTKLSKIYPNVTNYQMEALERRENGKFKSLVYTHRMMEGTTKIRYYGIKLLLQTAMPRSIKINAIRFAKQIVADRAKILPLVKRMSNIKTLQMSAVEEIENFMTRLHTASVEKKLSLTEIKKFQRLAKELLDKYGKNIFDIEKKSPELKEMNSEVKDVDNNPKENIEAEQDVIPEIGGNSRNIAASLPPQLSSIHTTSSSTDLTTATI